MPRQMPASQPRFMWAVLMLLSCPRYLAVSSMVLLVGWVRGFGVGRSESCILYGKYCYCTIPHPDLMRHISERRLKLGVRTMQEKRLARDTAVTRAG